MLFLISPAKTQDFTPQPYTPQHTLPEMLPESQRLMQALAQLSAAEIAELMEVSEKIATLNHARFSQFDFPFTPENALQALFAFRGDVYQGFSFSQYSEEDFAYAQAHLRILSGLYGVLRPLDLIQPYRLEMKTRLRNERGNDLYTFWGNQLTDALNVQGQSVVVNLASDEYFRAIQPKRLKARLLTPIFKEKKGDSYKIVSFFAKKARGMMANFAMLHRIEQPEDLKAFCEGGYAYQAALSTADEWVFTRE